MDRRTVAIVSSTSVLSLIGGVFAGYFYAWKKAEKEFDKFDDRLKDELEKAHAHYKVLYKQSPQMATPQALAEELAVPIFDDAAAATLIVQQYQGTDDSPLREIQKKNVFEEDKKLKQTNSQEWQRFLASRDTSKPYILHLDEYHEDKDYDEAVLEYFVVDEVLCTTSEEVINTSDIDNLVGLENLKNFDGRWSNDPNVLYIRNEQIKMDYEINLNKSSYAKEVLGVEPESRPENRQQPGHQKLPARERYERGTRTG